MEAAHGWGIRPYHLAMASSGDGFFAQLRSYGRVFFTNWTSYDAGFLTKVGLTLRNRTRAVVTLKGCCGNHGQPGC
jgi:hypothetical protein